MSGKWIKLLLKRIFSAPSPRLLYLACAAGVLIGMLPLAGARLPALLAAAVAFRLNLVFLLLGLFLTLAFPAVEHRL